MSKVSFTTTGGTEFVYNDTFCGNLYLTRKYVVDTFKNSPVTLESEKCVDMTMSIPMKDILELVKHMTNTVLNKKNELKGNLT